MLESSYIYMRLSIINFYAQALHFQHTEGSENLKILANSAFFRFRTEKKETKRNGCLTSVHKIKLVKLQSERQDPFQHTCISL